MIEEPSHGATVRALLALFAVAVFFTSLDFYAFTFWSAPPPSVFMTLFIGGAAALALVNARAPMSLLRSPLLLWALAYFLVTTLWAVWMRGTPRVASVLNDRYRSMALLLAFATVLDDPRVRRLTTYAIAAAVVFASTLHVAELLGLVDLASRPDAFRIPGRAGGLYLNPNSAGHATVFGLAVACTAISRRWRIPLLVVGAIGVFATFSRGAELCLVACMVVLVWRKYVDARSVAALGVVLALLLATRADRVVSFLDSKDALTKDTVARLSMTADDSGRGYLARKGWEFFLQAPLLGNGLGATVDWTISDQSSHNQFLNLAGDHGVLGFVLFPALALAIAVGNPAGAALAVALMLAGLFSHNLLEDSPTLLAVALAAARSTASDARADAPAEGGVAAAEAPLQP